MKRKITAVLALVAMMLSVLSGCGKRLTPMEGYYQLMEEANAVALYEADVRYSMDIDGDELECEMHLVFNLDEEILAVSGEAGALGLSVKIPQTLIHGDQIYMDGDDLANLLTFTGIDYDGSITDLLDDAVLLIDGSEAEDGEETELPALEGTDRLLGMLEAEWELLKSEVNSREALFASLEEGDGYVLCIEDQELAELLLMVLEHVSQQRDAYIETLTVFGEEWDEGEVYVYGFDEENLNLMFDELETMLEETEEALDEWHDGLSFAYTSTVRQDKEGTYHLKWDVAVTDADGHLNLTFEMDILPLDEVPLPELPERVVSYEELEDAMNKAMSALYGDFDAAV